MKIGTKRALAMLLSLTLSLTLLSGAALAVETYTTSDACVKMIEELEGYRQMPYADNNGKWYVGYGVSCSPSDYPEGITEEEAELLLRQQLVTAEELVNSFLLQYGIAVAQHQFDALVSMTYTLGSQWINPDYRLCAYLINGIERYSEAEVVNAIATWCHSGTTVLENLVSRRLREAFLFLYGDYDFRDGESRYCYIDYETNGGKNDPNQGGRTVFYPLGAPYGQLPTPTREGSVFQGWFTADGVQMTGAETAMGSLNLYARWEGGSSEPAVPTTPTVVKPDYSSWVNPYRDVKDSDWHYSYVRELSYEKILGGYPDGTFQPDGMVTAGEALKLLLVAAIKTDPGNAGIGHWAGNYLALAEGMGCVSPGEITNLDAAIDRLTIARIAAIAMALPLKNGPTPFADVDDAYALTLYEAGVITGEVENGQRCYRPSSGISRAEMCAIVSRLRNYTPPNDPAQSGYILFRNKQIPVLWDVPTAPYNKDLFVRDGSRLYYNDPAYVTEWGIDVSRHQGNIDWQKVAGAGVEFALIRAGGRLAQSGELYDDANFEANLTGAQAAGLKTGVYFYSQAVNVAEAVEEAQYTLALLNGRALEYPIIFDWEIYSDTARSSGVDKQTLTDCAIAFCDTVTLAGYKPMIYISLEVAYEKMDLSRLTGYDFWFAQYNSRNQPDMYYNYRIWQYTDSGSIPGIEGRVDMDLAFIPY